MASKSMSPPSSSSSIPTRSWRHDVFLSFRGEDTRHNIVDHLYHALVQKGIHVFKDDKMLPLGKSISPELLRAIEDSKIAVVILSQNYANSSWCLDELAKIMECQDKMGQKVLPVFYHVDPSDVKGQKREYAKAFEQHEEKFKGMKDRVNKWREALTSTANLSGCRHISADNGGESAFINNIVNEILLNIQPSHRDNTLVGIESRVEALNSLLSIEATQEARMIGIAGMGGIGKTTITQTLFRRIAYKFEGSSFVNNVRENSSTTKDICLLQEKILKDILVLQQALMIQDLEHGANMIQLRLKNKRVLLILDDVDASNQLEYLVGARKWFGQGSRIIVTTRDEHLLSYADDIYKPALLLTDQAVELFSRHAFRKNNPPREFKDLSNRAIFFTGRLPLALKVLGSFFRGRNKISDWESALAKLDKTTYTKVTDTLKFSFDNLHVLEQKIFLDIACFFKGKDIKDVTRKLDSFGFHPVIGIEVLIEKSLITVTYGKIDMHDLIQELGQKIACKDYSNSRLWKHQEITYVIKKEEVELKRIEAIVEPQQDEKLDFSADVFKAMKNLRLLDVYHNFTSCEPAFLPNELRWLCWFQYPFPSMPLENMQKLVGLELSYGRIKHLWDDQKVMMNLKYIRFCYLSSLERFPDVSEAPNIERLLLSSCQNLVEVNESIGSHKRLVRLEMLNCSKLSSIPSKLDMESLETLILINCYSLERFPKFSSSMARLSHINLHGCHGIKELSSSIRHLSKLRFLNLEACTGLTEIPNSIYELKHLRKLCLHDCRGLQKLPEEFGSMDKLQELQLGSNDYFNPFEGHVETINFHVLTNLCSLRKLDLGWRQIGEEDFPKNFHGLASLEELNISHNSKLTQLPASISHLSSLKLLELDECTQLQILHALPSGVQVLKASHCSSLEKINDLSNEHGCLYMIWLLDCQKLLSKQENKKYLDIMSNETFIKRWAYVDHALSIAIPGSNIPSWFKEQHGNEITLKLHPGWQSHIMGFAICGVFKQPTIHPYHRVQFRYEVDAIICDPKSPGDSNNAPTTSDNENLWIGFIPFGSFVQMRDDNHLQHVDWSNIMEGNIIVTVGLSYHKAVRCGACVVYKEDVESIQQTNSCISYYWNWDLVYMSHNTILACDPLPYK
ncbi:TMV resistance protein N-like [Bidens hawaiensis]|uniref:TMV resistance protein N-like n=1 Tax=Bidens hawaiensis TaxID=980011 RepID=UPI0040498A88